MDVRENGQLEGTILAEANSRFVGVRVDRVRVDASNEAARHYKPHHDEGAALPAGCTFARCWVFMRDGDDHELPSSTAL